MTSPFLIEQFQHDRWANLLWLRWLEEASRPDDYRAVVTHLLGAQETWASRLEGVALAAFPSPELSAESIETLFERSQAIVANRPMGEIITYRRFTGEELQATLVDIALHIVYHGTYHRGELRGLCRKDQITDFPETDHIRFTLERSALRSA